MNETMKLVLVGQMGAGKTSLLQSLRQSEFRTQNTPTVGVDYSVIKNVSINGQLYDISIWDTAGQEKYRSITKLSFKNANVAILCFDLSDPDSYLHLKGWIDFININCPSDIGIVLVGTKMDLPSFYTQDDLQKVLQDYNLKWFITSSKTNEGVNEAFQYAYQRGAKKKINENSFQLSYISEDKTKKNSCLLCCC